MATINYVDKEALNVNPNILDKNKVNASDMNLIKVVGNQILTTMGVYTDDWNSATTYAIGEIAIYDNRIFKNLTGTNTATTPDQDTTNWEETTISSMAAGAASGDTLPIGSIVPYGTTTAPTNWLVCDGSAVSRTTYANLFAVIGTSFGSGDGSTTFNLPNLKGRVAVGQDTSDTSFDTIGETGGEKTHTLTIQEMPVHNHAIGLEGGSDTGANISYSYNNNKRYYGGTDVIQNAGNGASHNNLQPYQVVCYIIKANQSAGLVADVSNVYSTSQSDTYSCDYVNNMNKRSSTEIKTGKTWIDGKPIYSIVVNVGALPNNASLNVPTSTFDGANKFITQMYGIGASAQEEYLKIPYYATDQNYINLIINSTHQISISTGADRSRFTGYIYLEYTKTTD